MKVLAQVTIQVEITEEAWQDLLKAKSNMPRWAVLESLVDDIDLAATIRDIVGQKLPEGVIARVSEA